MLRCLFWNQNENDLSKYISTAAKSMRLDVIMLCETGKSSARTKAALGQESQFSFSTGLIVQRLHVYTRFSKRFIKVVHEDERFLIFKIDLPARDEFLLMLLHGPSKQGSWTPAGQAIEASRYAHKLRELQARTGINKSLVVGDFNMNPFEPGMTSAGAFNAVMDSRQARKEVRTVQKQKYSYFYNPMWALLGDLTPGPPASYFFESSTHEELHWHMLDQVIVSPEMIDSIDTSSLRVLDTIGKTTLVTPLGRPRTEAISDHLPLYFELRI